jgi:hypothetical protein
MYQEHQPGDKIVHYDPGAFAPIAASKARLTGEVGVAAFNNMDEDAPGVTARYKITKHTSFIPPSYADRARDTYEGILAFTGQSYQIPLRARSKLPVPIADGSSVYGEMQAFYNRYLYAWLTPGTTVDEALIQHIVDNASLRINSSDRVLRQFIYDFPIASGLTPTGNLTVVWKPVTEGTLTVYGHWTVATVDFTNLGYPVRQRVFTVEEP